MQSGTLVQILDNLGEFLSSFSVPLHIGIKINLQSPPQINAPRTDKILLECVIKYLLERECFVTILEGADGHLRENMINIGLGKLLMNPRVNCVDLDMETDIEFYEKGQRKYPIPKVLQKMDIRIAIPCATKRTGYMFSCNVKTFVGILPRNFCQNGINSNFSRPLIHEDLTETVSDLYCIVEKVALFHFYINGGNTFSEGSNIRYLPQYFCSTDPVELDEQIAQILRTEEPGYLKRLKKIKEVMELEK